jgi:molybdate transport system permease protein
MIQDSDLTAFFTSVQLAGLSTLILLLLGSPLAWWLANTRSRSKVVFEAIIALPLVLPPTVLGFYLLISLSSGGFIGKVLNELGFNSLAFSFSGLVFGSVLYSLPFVVQPLQNAFGDLGKQPLEIAATLGASPWDSLVNVVLPLTKPAYITASVLGFAHTMGEFGVVLMLGGNIPGETQVLSIAIYDHVEALEYGQAHVLAGGLLLLSFLVLLLVYVMNRKTSVMKLG